jgi:hypothetical protein
MKKATRKKILQIKAILDSFKSQRIDGLTFDV